MERYGTTSAGANRVQTLQTVSSSESSGCRTPFLTTRQFLQLTQPVDEASLPIPRIAEKGRTYTFPFVFVIPERLLPTACSHRYQNDLVQDAHLRLPPSLGDGTSLTVAGCTLDDGAPDMTKIIYALRVRIMKRRESDSKIVTLADSSRRVRIIPTYEDQPPVMVDDSNKDHVLRKEKDVRKGFLKGKLGRLAIEAQQPKPLQTCKDPSACPPTTMIPISVTFTPSSPTSEPPSLSSLSARLRTVTSYSTQPITYFPTKGSTVLDGTLGTYHESSFLSSRCLAGVKWAKHEGPSPSSVFYAAQIQVPVMKPKSKVLVPTFYSCLAARTYIVELSLSINASGTLGTHPTLSLKVPVQVSSPGPRSPSSPGPRSPSSSASSLAEDEIMSTEQSPAYNRTQEYASEFFTPRSIAPPTSINIPLLSDPNNQGQGQTSNSNGGGNSQLPLHMRVNRPNLPPPPGYAYFSSQAESLAAPVRIPSPVGISPGCG